MWKQPHIKNDTEYRICTWILQQRYFEYCRSLTKTFPTFSRDDSIDFLVVGISAIPSELVLQTTFRLENLLENDSLNRHQEVHDSEIEGDGVGGELDHDGGHVAGRFTAVVDQIEIRSRHR